MVEGERPNRRAIDRIDNQVVRPHELFSRSANVRANRERLRAGGRMPSVRDSNG